MQLRTSWSDMMCLPLLATSEENVQKSMGSGGSGLPFAHIGPSGIVKFRSPKPEMIIETPFMVPKFRLMAVDGGDDRSVLRVGGFLSELKTRGAKCAFEHYDRRNHLYSFIFWFDVSSINNRAYCCVSAYPSTLNPWILPVLYAKEIDPAVLCTVRLLDRALAQLLKKHRIPLRNHIPRCGSENIDRLFS